MESKNISIQTDKESGITLIPLGARQVVKSVSLSDEGCSFLDSLGADVILHFDNDGKLVEMELMGL